MWCSVRFEILNRLGVDHECDGRTDGQKDRQNCRWKRIIRVSLWLTLCPKLELVAESVSFFSSKSRLCLVSRKSDKVRKHENFESILYFINAKNLSV